MPEIIPGDKNFETIPSIKDKALRINLNENIQRLKKKGIKFFKGHDKKNIKNTIIFGR